MKKIKSLNNELNSDPITQRAPVPSVKIDADDSVEFDVTDEDQSSIRINSDGCREEEAGVDEGDQIGAVHRRATQHRRSHFLARSAVHEKEETKKSNSVLVINNGKTMSLIQIELQTHRLQQERHLSAAKPN